MLEDAGLADGEFELKWAYVTSDPTSVKLKNLVVRRLEAAGFKATPVPTPTGDAWTTLELDSHAPVNLRIDGWCSDWPSGSVWFPLLFHSEGGYNNSYFAESAVDKEIDRIGLLPIDDQPAAWGALDKTIMTDYYPAVVTGYDGVAMLHGSRIGGVKADDIRGMPTWKDIYVMQ